MPLYEFEIIFILLNGLMYGNVGPIDRVLSSHFARS